MKMKTLALALAFAPQLAPAAEAVPAPRQDLGALAQAAEAFLRKQTAGVPGEVVVQAGPVDSRLSLPACAAPEPFLMPGSRLSGNLTLGVRCVAPATWTVYVPASVKVMTNVVVGARPLAQGSLISAADLAIQKADIAQLPGGAVTDFTDAIGKTAAMAIMPGQPLRPDMLRSPPVVLPGQSVKLVSRGQGFEVTSEGKAMGPAAAGQTAQVRVATGQVVSGIARPGGVVEITF